MNLKNLFIYLLTLTVLLQCVSGLGLNCLTANADGSCATCVDVTFVVDPTNRKNCRLNTVAQCTAWSFDLKQCVECKHASSEKYTIYSPGTKCTINYCALHHPTISNECESCAIGYQLTLNKQVCQDRISNCKRYESNTKCLQCDMFYEPSTNFDLCNTGSILNCNTYSASKVCAFCNPGFQPSLNKDKCNLGSINNCQFYQSLGKCYSCLAGYVLSTDKTKCTDSIPNCATYTGINPTTCSVCINGYAQVSGRCVEGTVTQCKSYTTNAASCSTCNDFFEPTGTGTCKIGSIGNCKVYSGLNDCQKCADLFMPSGATSCVTGMVPYCKSYTANNNCQACNLGFIRTASGVPAQQCTPRIENCKQFTTETTCKKCLDTFRLSTDFTKCLVGTIPNCLTYATLTTCDTCALGYRKNAIATLCNNQIPFCKLYSAAATGATPNYICDSCLDNYQPALTSSKISSCTPVTTGATGQNCKIYSGPNICTQCQSGYVLTGSICIKATAPITTCQLYGSSTVCKKCPDNNMPSADGSSCIAGTVTNCLTYSGFGVCQTCNANTLSIQVISGATVCLTKINGCKQRNAVGDCTLCDDYLKVSGSTTCIVGTISNCKVYSATGICTTCDLGYTPATSSTTCAGIITGCKTYGLSGTTTICSQCIQGKQPNSGKTQCLNPTASQNCLMYSAQNVCTQCAANYRFATAGATTCTVISGSIADCALYGIQTVCTRCITLTQQPSSDGSACAGGTTVTGCQQYSARGVCTACVSAKQLIIQAGVTKCVVRVAKCKVHNIATGDCTTCQDYYEPSGTTSCVRGTVQNCIVYASAGVCSDCAPGYTDGASCTITLTNCKKVNSAGVCIQCDDNFQPDASPITACENTGIAGQNCLVYSGANVCSQCATGYALSTSTSNVGKCQVLIPPIPNCVDYRATGQCKKCADLYWPTATTGAATCANTGSVITKCKTYSEVNVCQVCDMGYTLTPPTTCTGNVQFCQTYSSNTNCQQCNNGYHQVSLTDLTRCVLGTNTNCLIYSAFNTCSSCILGYQGATCTPKIPNCKVYASAGTTLGVTCTQCNDNYEPNTGSTTCTQGTSSQNCLIYSAMDACYQCKPGYKITTVSDTICGLVTTNITGCLLYGQQGQCRQCDVQKRPGATANTCQNGQINNCSLYSATAVCSVCDVGYTGTATCTNNKNCKTFYPNGTCLLCNDNFEPTADLNTCNAGSIGNCKAYKSKGVCLQCVSTFQPTLDFTKCLAGSIQHCTIYESKGRCKQCLTDYKPSDDKSKCQDKIAFCKPGSYSGTTTIVCTDCRDGYYLSTGGASCTQGTVQNCKTYNQATPFQCSSCNDGFFLNPSKACVNPITDCKAYTSADECNICVDGKMPSAAVTGGATIGASCVNGNVANCIAYVGPGAGTCSQCKIGYNGATCSATNGIPNCQDYTSTTVCAQCKNTFQPSLNYGTCSTPTSPSAITNCLSYSSFTQCRVCTNFNQPSSNFRTCTTGSIPNCKQYESKGVCKTCDNGYLINTAKTQCTDSIANCKTYDLPIGTDNPLCGTCKDNYQPNTAKNACGAPSITNCMVFSDTAQCSKCANGYYLLTNTCTKGQIVNCTVYGAADSCSKCIQGYMPTSPSGAECEEGTILKCKVYSAYSTCQTCMMGYNLAGNACTGKITSCLNYSSDTKCSQCDSMLQPSQDYSSCIAGNILHCLTYSQFSKCSLCQSLYEPNAEFTVCSADHSILNCMDYASKGKCSKCIRGFKVTSDNTKCIDTIPNCLTYNAVDVTICDKCKNTFQPNTQKKECFSGSINGCSQYTSKSVCLTCADKFLKNSDTQCKLGSIIDCLTYSSATACSKCIDGKMPSAAAGALGVGASCVNGSIATCKSYSGNGACGVCMPGYSLPTCTVTMPGCKIPLSETQCKTCNDNFIPNDLFTSCTAQTTSKCLVFSSSTKCAQCQDTYEPTLDLGDCLQGKISNCKTYVFNRKCSLCQPGYVPSADMSTCIGNITNCKAYTTAGLCSQCQNGYQPDTDKKKCLTGSIANCMTYSAKGACSACVDYYGLTNPTVCTKGTIIDCITYGSPSSCIKCVDFKYASGGSSCAATSTTHPNCKTYSSVLKCLICKVGYSLSQTTVGNCDPNIANCLTYNTDTSCKLCANGTEPTADTKKCQPGSITDCITYLSNGYCSICLPAYKLSGDKKTCVDTIPNCNTYNTNVSLCDICDNGFEPAADKKTCINGTIPNCLTYSISGTTKTCTKCNNLYYLSSSPVCKLGTITDCLEYNSETACLKCIDGKMQVNSNAQCATGLVSNCKSYSSNYVCSACNLGYTLRSVSGVTQCVKSIPNCNVFASQTTCKQCDDTFQISVDGRFCAKGSISNCVIYQANKNCNKCVPQFKPSSDFTKCVQTVPNCQTYDLPTTCKTCMSTFEPSADFTSCNPGTNKGCLMYEALGKCQSCDTGYTHDSITKKCTIAIANCLTFSASTTCTKCADGYYLSATTANNLCILGSIQNCRQYISQTVCNFCVLNYETTQNKQKCYQIIRNCRVYTATFDKCQTCIDGYEPTSTGQCRVIINQCATYNEQEVNSTCASCNTGFTLVGTTFCKVSSNLCNIINCLKCTTADYCDTCDGGYQVSLDHKRCIKCNSANCVLCKSDDSCGLCQPGYQMVSTYQNLMFIDKCISCNVANCKFCESPDTCSSCENGYSLNGFACTLCDFKCQTCGSDGACITCKTPTYVKTPIVGVCSPARIPNCEVYQTATPTNCAKCQPFFNLTSDKKACNRACSINCKQCTGINSCTACNVGYFLYNSACRQCVQGCAECTSLNYCTKAISLGFYLANNYPKPCQSFCKQCDSGETCTVFNDNYNGFILVKINNQDILAQCQQTCQVCSPTNLQQCITCKPGYYRNLNNKCQVCGPTCRTCNPITPSSCLSCYPNAFLVGSTCNVCPATCMTCDSTTTTTCRICVYGHYLDVGHNCVPVVATAVIEQCVGYMQNNLNTCEKCAPGYTLIVDNSKTICVPCVANCRSCAKGQPSNCLDCGDNFYLNSQNKCISCSSNCKKCTSSGCSQCNRGFRVNSGSTCSKNCIQPCGTCSDSNPKTCNSCILGYNLIGGSCEPQTNCNGGCKICPSGFTLSTTNTCVACKSQNCRTCDLDRSTCTTCIRGFYLASTKLCLPCSDGCSSCRGTASACSSCADGYIQQKSISQLNSLVCIACKGACATCIDVPTRCLTCKQNYELVGWRCMKKSRMIFSVTLDASLSTFNGKYYKVLNALARSDSDYMIFEQIRQGSVILKGSINPVYQTSDPQFKTQFVNIQKALFAGGAIDDMKIISSSLTVSGYSTPSSQQQQQQNNLGLILGICIPVGILIIAIVIYVIHKKMTPQIKDGKLDDDTKMTSKHELQKNQFEMSDNILKNN